MIVSFIWIPKRRGRGHWILVLNLRLVVSNYLRFLILKFYALPYENEFPAIGTLTKF